MKQCRMCGSKKISIGKVTEAMGVKVEVKCLVCSHQEERYEFYSDKQRGKW